MVARRPPWRLLQLLHPVSRRGMWPEIKPLALKKSTVPDAEGVLLPGTKGSSFVKFT